MSRSKRELAKVILLRRLRKRLKRKPRACNIRPIFYNRHDAGESLLVRELKSDPEYHRKYFRMSKDIFEELLSRSERYITVGRRHCRPISQVEKLAITLRYLASGNSQFSMSMGYRISPSAVGQLLRESMEAICHVLEPEVLNLPTTDEWRNIEKGFLEKWNVPNCCGAIDGKHIRLRAPKHSGSVHFNYKGFFSIVLLAVVDPFYQFRMVDIGASGSQSDGGILGRSAIGQALQDGSVRFPADKRVGDVVLPHMIIEDDAFPLRRNLMKPFPGRELTTEKRIYNYRMSRAQMVSENGFGILSARWRIFHTTIIGDLDFAKLIVKTCVVLHNFLMTRNEMSGITIDDHNEMMNGNWREQGDLMHISVQRSSNHALPASEIRNHFMNYFNGDGAVSWQNQRI